MIFRSKFVGFFLHRKKSHFFLFVHILYWMGHSPCKNSIGSYKMYPFLELNSWFVALKPDLLCRISGTDKFSYYTKQTKNTNRNCSVGLWNNLKREKKKPTLVHGKLRLLLIWIIYEWCAHKTHFRFLAFCRAQKLTFIHCSLSLSSIRSLYVLMCIWCYS